MSQGKEITRSWREVNITTGTYMTFGAVVMQLGGWGWDPAVLGARRLVARCCLLGGRWTKLDTFSGLEFYLVLNQSFSEEFEKCWKDYEKHWNATVDARPVEAAAAAIPEITALAPAAVETALVDNPKAKAKAAMTPKAKPKSKAKSKVDLSEPMSPEVTVDVTVVREALQVKAMFLKARASADSLISRVRGGAEEWKWCNHDELIGTLEKGIEIINKSMTSFMHDFVLGGDMKMLREAVGQVQMTAEFSNFVALRANIGDLAKQNNILLEMSAKKMQR